MPEIQCPNCAWKLTLDNSTYWSYEGSVRCPDCGIAMNVSIEEGELQYTPSFFAPVKVKSSPKEVASDFLEAQICHSAKAHKACIVMCRRTLETVCESLGAKGRTLLDKIGDLYSREIISKRVYDIATQLRQFGNYGAHPKNDLLGGILESDSDVILEVTQHILTDIYEIPDKIETLRKRLSKKESSEKGEAKAAREG